jgi:GNAT superfamily N-acetyltransferase
MKIEIKALTPELGETFIDYVRNIDFSYAPHWQFCHCQYYHLNCDSEVWRSRTSEQNEILARQNIRDGIMQGFLAFDAERVVGWINANDWRNYALLENDEELLGFEGKSGLVVCFLIHPDYRRQGLAKKLLKTAVENFREKGYDRVIGRPFFWSQHPERQYHGVPAMYEELGFEKISEINGVSTYMLDLK